MYNKTAKNVKKYYNLKIFKYTRKKKCHHIVKQKEIATNQKINQKDNFKNPKLGHT